MRDANPETNHRYAVVQDLATQRIQSYPRQTESSHGAQKSFFKFLEPSHKPKVVYTYKSMEFGRACEVWSWNHRTSTPHRSETSGIAERANPKHIIRWSVSWPRNTHSAPSHPRIPGLARDTQDKKVYRAHAAPQWNCRWKKKNWPGTTKLGARQFEFGSRKFSSESTGKFSKPPGNWAKGSNPNKEWRKFSGHKEICCMLIRVQKYGIHKTSIHGEDLSKIGKKLGMSAINATHTGPMYWHDDCF